jgi:hypothetical protein
MPGPDVARQRDTWLTVPCPCSTLPVSREGGSPLCCTCRPYLPHAGWRWVYLLLFLQECPAQPCAHSKGSIMALEDDEAPAPWL